MKLKALSVAISSIVLAGFAQSSLAQNYPVYLAGSSAQDNLVMAEAANLCLPYNATSAPAIYYVDDNFTAGASGYGNNYKVLTCTVDTTKLTSGFAAGDTITFYKTNLGGSAQGVDPLWNNTTANFMNPATTTCTANGTANIGGLSGVPEQVCAVSNQATSVIAQPLDLGVSDVNPAMFQGVNQTTTYNPSNGNVIKAFSPVTTNSKSGVTLAAGPALIWAFPVTLNLYTALQAAQGLLNVSITDATSGVTLPAGACAAGAYNTGVAGTDNCMPSLTKAQITSLLMGNISDWSSMYFSTAASAGQGVNLLGAATAYSAAILPSGGDTTVNVCLRTAGSGTAASQYAYFLNQPANQAKTSIIPVSAFQANNTVATQANGGYVYSVQDGGNMESCLVDLATGPTSPAAVNYAGSKIDTAGHTAWAFGQQSSDKNASAAKQYRFIKIDGVAPTLANAYSGAYDFVNESTWQYPTTPRTAQAGAVAAKLVSVMQNPTTIYNDLDKGAVQPFGAAGFMTTYANALAWDTANSSTLYANLPNQVNPLAPITPWTRNNTSSAVNLDNGSPQLLNGAATLAP